MIYRTRRVSSRLRCVVNRLRCVFNGCVVFLSVLGTQRVRDWNNGMGKHTQRHPN